MIMLKQVCFFFKTVVDFTGQIKECSLVGALCVVANELPEYYECVFVHECTLVAFVWVDNKITNRIYIVCYNQM